ncbi:hypothetical protein ARMGADRAFT_42345 [Armillaria gallica]|uniref:Uncharacterized protein n=1 Tax=Armillaria gallica TaxID=47427 RepID=A0A2H3E9J9_ARMGA|nr:hypothetical protein ARMGADRAFT_42345 [Armillaria gallica]
MKIVTSSLSFLLGVSVGTFAKDLAYKPHEIEARHFWNVLLYISFFVSGAVDSQRLVSVCLPSFPSAGPLSSRLEIHLSPARNKALDLSSDEAKSLTALEQHARTFLLLCGQAEGIAIRRHGANNPIAVQAKEASDNAYEHSMTDLRIFVEKEDGPSLSYTDNNAVITATQNEEVTSLVRIYDDLTEYRKPTWDTPPSVDVGVKPIFDLLMCQSADLDVTAPSSERLSADDSYPSFKSKSAVDSEEHPTLDPSLMKVISSSLSFLLCVSVGGFAKGLAYEPNETEAMHCWDFLLYISFVVSGEVVSQRLLLERYLSLPRNIILDLASNIADAKLRTEERVKASLTLCLRAFHKAHEQYGVAIPVWGQALESLSDASLHHSMAIEELMDAPYVAEVIQRRA